MPSYDLLLLFLSAAFLVTLAPGPDNLMVASLAVARGRRAGVAFGVGCGIGCLSHTFLAVVGISAAIAASPTAFFILRLAGAIYLAFLGFSAIRSTFVKLPDTKLPDTKLPDTKPPDAKLPALFLRGMIANAINPKVIVFFLAFLPQFVAPERGNAALQMAIFGALFTLQAAAIFAMIALATGSMSEKWRKKPNMSRWLDRVAGCVFIGLAVKLIV